MIVLSIIVVACIIICTDSKQIFNYEIDFGLSTKSNNESCQE
jgi:hypothetical protein